MWLKSDEVKNMSKDDTVDTLDAVDTLKPIGGDYEVSVVMWDELSGRDYVISRTVQGGKVSSINITFLDVDE